MENISTFGIYNSLILLGFFYLTAFIAANKRYLQSFPSVFFLSFYTLSFLHLLYRKINYKFVSAEDIDRNVYLLLVCVLFSLLAKLLKTTLYKFAHSKSTPYIEISENTKLSQQQIQTQDCAEKNINSVAFSGQEIHNQVNIINVKIKEQNLTENENKKIDPIDCDINIQKKETNIISGEFDAIKTHIKEGRNISFIARNIKNKFQSQASEINFVGDIKNLTPIISKKEELGFANQDSLIKQLEEHFVKKEIFEDQLLLVNKRIDMSIEDSQSFVDKITYFIKIINSELKKR